MCLKGGKASEISDQIPQTIIKKIYAPYALLPNYIT